MVDESILTIFVKNGEIVEFDEIDSTTSRHTVDSEKTLVAGIITVDSVSICR